MGSSQPLAQRDWTWEGLQALDDDGHRYEIVDGALLVVNPPTPRHDLLASRLGHVLDDAAPSGTFAYGPGGLRLDRTVRIPDVVLLRGDESSLGTQPLPTRDVLLVVEVESPSTTTTDRVTKAHEYAAAGIPHYWRLDPEDGPALSVHVLDGDVYRLLGTWRGEEQLVVEEPLALRLRPADLLRRH